jgi:hypothetical protein
VRGVRNLGDRVVAPDDDVLHVADLGAGLVGELGQRSAKSETILRLTFLRHSYDRKTLHLFSSCVWAV